MNEVRRRMGMMEVQLREQSDALSSMQQLEHELWTQSQRLATLQQGMEVRVEPQQQAAALSPERQQKELSKTTQEHRTGGFPITIEFDTGMIRRGQGRPHTIVLKLIKRLLVSGRRGGLELLHRILAWILLLCMSIIAKAKRWFVESKKL